SRLPLDGWCYNHAARHLFHPTARRTNGSRTNASGGSFMNRFRVCSSLVIIAVAFLFTGVASAQAQIVAFSQLRDAAPGKFFDAATSEAFAANGNRLNIGFNTGSDPTTFVSNAFRATTLSFGNRTASDTISFVVTAP